LSWQHQQQEQQQRRCTVTKRSGSTDGVNLVTQKAILTI